VRLKDTPNAIGCTLYALYIYRDREIVVQPLAFGVAFNLILQFRSNWSLFDGTWQKRHTKLDNWFSFEIGEMILQIFSATGCTLYALYIYRDTEIVALCVYLHLHVIVKCVLYTCTYIYTYISYLCTYICIHSTNWWACHVHIIFVFFLYIHHTRVHTYVYTAQTSERFGGLQIFFWIFLRFFWYICIHSAKLWAVWGARISIHILAGVKAISMRLLRWLQQICVVATNMCSCNKLLGWLQKYTTYLQPYT